MTIADVARMWRDAGVSCIPILANRTKRPAVQWREFEARVPTLDEVSIWWGNGSPYGIALICGAVSGNLEMTEIEGRAVTAESLTKIVDACTRLGVVEAWNSLVAGYSQQSPSGGLHLLYRISDYPVPGNEKIAVGPDKLVLAETRGEGGYVIGAPSPGSCHPNGEGWVLTSGSYGVLPVITWAERNLIHQAIQETFDIPTLLTPPPTSRIASAPSDHPPHTPRIDHPSLLGLTPNDLSQRSAPAHTDSSLLPPSPSVDYPARVLSSHIDTSCQPDPEPTDHSSRPRSLTTNPVTPAPHRPDLSPGDDFAIRTDWADLLEPLGWQLESVHSGGERMWTRPDKNRRDGASASTDYQGKPGLYVWSTSTGLPTEEPLSKLFVLAHYHFHGDLRTAAQDLARRGYGSRSAALLALPGLPSSPQAEPDPGYLPNDGGNARYLWDEVKGRYLWLTEERQYYHWDNGVWRNDQKSTLEYEFLTLTERRAVATSDDEKATKRWVSAGNIARIEAALRCMRTLPGVSYLAEQMNPNRHLLNVRNGVLDLRSGQLQPHDPELLMTRMANATFDPNAQCPQFEQFMADVLPDEGMRRYVQRALGYTLLGDADQRAMFLVYGPSGTGKSTLMEVIREVLGDYAATAPAGTFKSVRDKGPSNDLHRLRGRRFVSTSETADNAAFDEDLLKRLTGRDRVSSRELYQQYQEWVPECSIWLATNHPPKFNSDDDAIWRRVKLIPFLTQFTGANEVQDMARRVLCPEASGILNWLLAGLASYREQGLAEPTQVQEAAVDQRLQSDSVARFMDDRIYEGVLQRGEGRQIKATLLHLMYIEWARQNGERAVGNRRFANRLISSLPDLVQVREAGHSLWLGIGQNSHTSILGTFVSESDK